ncbi:MAG: asparagine synthase (glutamine-hydrolyzing) [Nannocystis sp.]|nr:asparagine synthase (glutamine-hydrolyzing) [Nannocystis sp.]
MIGRHDPSLLAAMTASLRHRGWDGEGLHIDGALGLGHRRLAVLDLAGGAQPMLRADGQAVISFNGEIFNYQALRRELLAADQTLLRQGDTEVLLAGHQCWGVAGLLARLRGMFAFALWDTSRETLLLARDHLGIKPLYYAVLADGAMLFASEPKALLCCPEVDRGLDLTSLDAYLDLFYIPPPRSIFRGIQQLPPGHILTWHKGQLQIQRWFDPTPRALDPHLVRTNSLEAWAEAVAPVLAEAVALHTVSDVPLGAFLSGGLDSSAIVALMAEQSRHPVETFCVGYGPEGRSYEERPVARRVARYFGTTHRELELDIDLLGDLDAVVRSFDEPFGSWAALLGHRLSRFTRQHVTVALAGDGGDEVFGGYPRYRGLLLSQGLSHVPGLALARRVLARAGEPTTARSLRRWARQFLDGCQLPPPERYASWVAYAPPAARDRLYTASTRAAVEAAGRLSPVAAAFSEPGFGDIVQRAGYADLRGFLPENVLRGSDRMSMMHGLEVRVPFCDRALVELMAAAPASVRVGALASKRILRRIMRGKVPAEVLTRKKLGFTAPFGTWLKRAEGRIAADLLHPAQIARRGLFEPAEVARLLTEHRTGARDHSHRIWSLLVLEQWQRTYMDR